MSIANAVFQVGRRSRARAGVLGGAAVLAMLSGGPAGAGPLSVLPPVPPAPAAAQAAACIGKACAARVILVQEGGLLGRMREWRGAARASPPRAMRQRASFERRSARRSREASQRRSRGGERGSIHVGRGGGTYTTMCVRSCDGYFFPISFSTTEDRFGADQMACQARCPGMEVSLYVHKVMGETSDQMRSIYGTPYSDLTNAFLYKLKGPQDPATCGCRIPAPVLQAAPALTVEPAAGDATPELWTVPLPRWRPDGESALAAIQTATLDAAPKEKTIRVVGPAFFPDQ